MRKGFSLIETILVIAIGTLVMLAVMSSVLYFYRTNSNTIEQGFALSSARKGIEFMVRDIREATYSDNGAYPIILLGDNSFSFYSDIDRDNSVEQVRYFLDGDFLKKGTTNSTGAIPVYNPIDEEIVVISDFVRNSYTSTDIFQYFDSTGVEVTDYNDITSVIFVKVNLIVNINPERLPEEFELHSSATLRNVKE